MMLMWTETSFRSAFNGIQECEDESPSAADPAYIQLPRRSSGSHMIVNDRGLNTYTIAHQYGNLIRGNLSGSGLMVSTV